MSPTQRFFETSLKRMGHIDQSITLDESKSHMHLDTLTIIGVGLIGGSIGLAAKERRIARRVLGLGRSMESLEEAKKRGAIDHIADGETPELYNSDLIILCTPVQMISAIVLEIAPHCKPGAILTDAGSVKAKIVAEIDNELPEHVKFVGSHPIAGSEKKGSAYASAQLFENRLTVITPTDSTDRHALETVTAFWQALGSHTRLMSPEDHDAALAFTSHLPHLLASVLAGCLPEQFHELTATGFRDSTRIAAGDPDMWSGILVQNQKDILNALNHWSNHLEHFRRAIENLDEPRLSNLLTQAKKVRDALGS